MCLEDFIPCVLKTNIYNNINVVVMVRKCSTNVVIVLVRYLRFLRLNLGNMSTQSCNIYV
jgi:hypothetical protein